MKENRWFCIFPTDYGSDLEMIGVSSEREYGDVITHFHTHPPSHTHTHTHTHTHRTTSSTHTHVLHTQTHSVLLMAIKAEKMER